MKRKHFILALVAMLWSFSFSAYADDVIVVNSWAELKAALEASDEVQRSAARQRSTVMRTVSTASEETTEEETKTLIPNTPYYYEDFQTTKIQLGKNVVYDDALPISKSSGTTLDLNGYTVSGSESAEHAYPFYNYGKFLVVDNSEAGTGALYCGVKTGIKEDGVSINEEAVFVMTGGNIICTHDNEEDAAVVNYGIAYITGGTIEGANNAVLNQDGATMNILDGVLITGNVKGTGINAADGVYTVAQIGTTKYGTLQAAIDAAVDGDVITLVTDVTEDEVLITQKADVDVTIDGAGKTFTGHMTIDGANRYTGAETLTIKNVVFQAVDGKSECIAGAENNAYAHNVTIEGCTFKGNDTYSYNNTFAVRFPSGAQAYGLTIKDCTADAKMFGLLWVSNIGKGATLTDGLIVDKCTAVGVQEGITLTTTSDAKIINSTIDATGVVIRAGQGGQAVDGKANNIILEENHLTSDGDVIVLRGDATDANLSMYRNAVSGTTHISGNTTDTKVSADANYWDGNNAPLVGSTDTPISVNSYYADEALTDLKRNATGSINAFVKSDRIFGEVTSNASESLVIEVIGADGNVIGKVESEKAENLIGTTKTLTWRINLGADDSGSWAMTWNEGAPSANNMPAKVKLYVDGKEEAVAEAPVKLTANGDGASPVFAAKTDADGKILSFVACEGEYNLNNANAKLTEVATAAATGDIITLIADGEYTLPVFAGKELTFKGINKEGVIINDAPDARTQGWNGSTIHFENLTAKGATANYHGLANGVVAVTYTNCNIEGLRFLYANEVSFDGCTFNAEGVEHSFWTYGASNVTVKNSTFTYTDRAVNCYSESGAEHETDITFEGCSFTYAGTAAEPAGAVEINSGSIKSIDVDFNNCTAPANGAMWFNSQWDSKKGDKTIVRIDGNVVWSRQPRGNDITGYVSETRIWGDTWGNAVSSYVVKVLDAEGNVMGETSLNNVDGIIDGDLEVTWGINFVGESTDPYWTWSWTTRPSITNMPAKVQLWIDGAKVSEGDINYNAPDNLKQIVTATTDADGNITACYTTLADACAAGNNVAILTAGTYSVPTGKDLTITGAVEGVEFGPIAEPNMGMKNYTFNNVTFNYANDSHYKGLQYAGTMVYNNCTFNGQVFLYGQSETFNNCTFNQEDSNYYNVWTYSAKDVAFNKCTFNSAGKSVLVYNEGAGATDLVVNETKFNASAAVEGKAAIEIDTSSMPEGTEITVDGVTTATGFASGSVSGSTLWNDKKADNANTNGGGTTSKVTVNDVVVKEPAVTSAVAKVGDEYFKTLAEALEKVENNGSVELLWKENATPISMAGTVCGNKTVTITGTAEVDWSKGWFYVGRNGEGNGKVIFDNANLTSTEASLTNGTYGINVSMAKYGNATTNDGEVVFKNSNIDLSVLIGKNNVTVDGGNLTVWYGFAVGARPASETNNVERTVTMNIVNGAKVVVKNHNGQGLGYEALGVMNIDATSSFETTQAFLVTAKGTMNVNGKASVAGTLTNNGTINLTAKDATLATPTAGLTVNTDVADYKVAYIDGVYKLVEKDYIAQVGDQKFEVFTDALDAVEDGGTITLLGGAFDESGKEIDFEEAITFTITGQAPEAKLPIVTFQNATVNIKDANFQIPELDARQNATINVDNSTVYSAGGNPIVKSYYNGAINIKNNSKVYTHQLTTMGYINVDGTSLINVTWQTNVFGNGMITLDPGATFNTAALQLTGKDYSGRDNTDDNRVGKPATIVVNGANFTAGKVYSASGADYSYETENYGINVGTIEGKKAILDIKNGANVNLYMKNRYTIHFGADAIVNVDASILNVAVRGEGAVTLANAGTVNVSGESNLAANVTGNGWFYMNGVSLDADTKLLGAKVRFASGENTVDGSTIDDGFFQVGIGAYNGVDTNVDTANGVVVNVKNNAKIGSNGSTYAGWVGTGFYDTDDEKAAVMTDAKYVLNIDNSIAEFGYLHVSNDGELNVNGKQYTTNYNNSYYAFYAGDFIINGTANFTATDVLALYTKVSCDNGTDKPGTLNINAGTEYEAERHNGAVAGTNFILYKTGVVNVAVEATLHIGEPSSIAADAALNIAGTATALGTITNNGAINFTNDAATLTTPTTDLTLGYNLNADKKVVYADGAYKVVSKVYVAQVGDVKYESLQEAIENVADNGTVTLLSDFTVTEAAHGQNALNHARAINFTLDLNGKTLSANTGNSVFRFNIAGSGATSDVTVTVKNGTVVSGADTWCALMASGISADTKAVMNLVDLTIENYKGGDFAVKAWDNGVVNAKNVKINASYGGGFYALGGEIVLDDCTVEQKGLWTAPYNSMTIGVSNGGKMTVNSGTYSALPVAAADGNNQGTSHGSWCGGVMSSGGTLIINGGTFSNGNIGGTASNPRELFIVGADADYGDNVAAHLEINGGTFNSIGALTHCETIWGSENDAANTYMPTMDVVITDGDFTGVAGKVIGGCDPISTGNPVGIAISGGVYTAATHALDNSYLADGYVIAKLDDTTDTVVEATVKVNDTYYATLEAGLKALTDDATLTLVKDITVAELWDCRKNGAKVTAANVTIDGNGKTLKLTGAVDDKNWNAVFRFEGDNATVKNLTIDASAATGIVRGITAKLSITVDNCTIIGNGITAKRAIIFGEGAGDALANVEATVTNSTFRNWTLGVSDNQSGKDAKSVTITDNVFTNASVHVSASENVTFDKNTLVGGYVNITSYTNKAGLSVHATENELDAEQVNEITVNPSGIYAQGGFSIPVAEVGGAYYLTLAGAISKANGATVTVLDDIILSEAVEVTTAAVLNLNDNSITPTTDATMTGGLFRLLDNADLTIVDETGKGEISNNGNANVYAAVSVLGNNAKLTVNGGNLTGYYYGIAGNGYREGTQVTINGGEIASIEATGAGIYHPQNGTLTVTDGTITGATGIYFKGGDLAISGGTVKGTGAEADYVYSGNGFNATGDALVIENVAKDGYEAIGTVSITGGTFISDNAAPIASYAPEFSTAKGEFLGAESVAAKFNNDNIDESLLVVRYQLKDEDGDGYYGVKYTNYRETYTIVDGSYDEFVNEAELSVGKLTYERTFKFANKWQALYVPFEIPVEALNELGYEAAYLYDVHNKIVAGEEIDPANIESIHFVKITKGTLRANYPYIIRPTSNADLVLNLTLYDAKLHNTAESHSVESSTTTTRYIFAGTYKSATRAELTGDDNIPFAISSSSNFDNYGGWAKMSATAKLPVFRIYMYIVNKDGSPVIVSDEAAKSIQIRIIGEENEDGTTTIYDVEADEQTVDYIYDLQGRRVLEPQKGGLYIVNGKKVIF